MATKQKPPYVNKPPGINHPNPKNLEHLEAEFYWHSNGMKDKDTVDRLIGFMACDAILLDVINHPDWERTDGRAATAI